MDVLKGLGKPREYAPIVVGATVGLVGMAYVMDQAKAWIGTMYPGQDWALWALYIGVCVVAVGVYMGSAKGTDWTSKAISSSAVAAIAVGGFSVLAKALAWQPITVGRMGAVRRPARPVNVVRQTTPTYAQAAPATPTFGAQAEAVRF